MFFVFVLNVFHAANNSTLLGSYRLQTEFLPVNQHFRCHRETMYISSRLQCAILFALIGTYA